LEAAADVQAIHEAIFYGRDPVAEPGSICTSLLRERAS
jgi:hypothetical protein